MVSFVRSMRAGQAGELWPVLLLLLVVAVPTISILWFVGIAMENQQLASKQQLTEAYRLQLQNVQGEIQDAWSAELMRLEAAISASPQERFARALANPLVDTALCYSANELVYPNEGGLLPDAVSTSVAWQQAADLEHRQQAYEEAAAAYQRVYAQATNLEQRAAALQGSVRCLFKVDRPMEAIRSVEQAARDAAEQLPLSATANAALGNVELLVLELAPRDADTSRVLASLARRAHTYDRDVPLSSPQRLFLLKRLALIAPESVDARRVQAEALAAELAEERPRPSAVRGRLEPGPHAGLWAITTSSGNTTLLLTTEHAQEFSRQAAKSPLPSGVRVELEPPDSITRAGIISLTMGAPVPGWRLALVSAGGAGMTPQPSHRLYQWIGILVVLFSSLMGLVIARGFQQKLRVANLKNDLAGTVSHELKTPLSSMRLLVDTLLEEDEFDPQVTREYLQLIAKENDRLSRLIENFLTFTRMDQGRYAFDRQNVAAAELVEQAVQAAGDRFEGPDCQFTVNQADPDLRVRGDVDSLVVALLNLLDNAYKYSSAPRRISLQVSRVGDMVSFAVRDNGIGLSRSAARRVFQRFYQVDQRLAREGKGCGLGLSIVDHIARAHQGRVTVTSEPQQGSAFALTIPALTAAKTPSSRTAL